MIPRMLMAYDAAGNVIATLDYCLALNPDGTVRGLVDFGAHEALGLALTDLWRVSGATGSATWPEFLGMQAHDYRVELTNKAATGLVHRGTGAKRDRAKIEAAIDKRISEAGQNGTADLRDLIGGPDRPLKEAL